MKVILAGGGTGGHLYPGIAVAERLHEKGIQTLFLVSDRGIERDVLTKLGYNFIEQDMSAFMGMGTFAKVAALSKLMKASGVVSPYISKGDKILLLGGFASAPAAVAGMFKGVDLYIHEQNSVMGTVNRLIAHQARRIFLSYPNTVYGPARGMYVGNPVRNEFFNIPAKADNTERILVLGGSGGSRAINNAMAAAAKELLKDGYTIHHQTGKKLEEEADKAYEVSLGKFEPDIELVPYIEDMAAAFKKADVVVARSGSGTVFETMYARRPAIFIPFASATGNHQYYNAKFAERAGYAKILEEHELTGETLKAAIDSVFEDLQGYRKRLQNLEVMDSARLIIKGMGL